MTTNDSPGVRRALALLELALLEDITEEALADAIARHPEHEDALLVLAVRLTLERLSRT